MSRFGWIFCFLPYTLFRIGDPVIVNIRYRFWLANEPLPSWRYTVEMPLLFWSSDSNKLVQWNFTVIRLWNKHLYESATMINRTLNFDLIIYSNSHNANASWRWIKFVCRPSEMEHIVWNDQCCSVNFLFSQDKCFWKSNLPGDASKVCKGLHQVPFAIVELSQTWIDINVILLWIRIVLVILF